MNSNKVNFANSVMLFAGTRICMLQTFDYNRESLMVQFIRMLLCIVSKDFYKL